jgi:hypothetical protein
MGLDVTALRKVKFISADGEYDDMTDQGYEWIGRTNRDWLDRADGRTNGYYSYEERLDFPAGSYSSYNAFRDWLSQTMLGVPAATVWDNTDAYEHAPFFELIHFADNEGVIGPGPAKRLAAAFIDFDEKAQAEGGDFFYESYANWTQAFKLAADDGLVEFH